MPSGCSRWEESSEEVSSWLRPVPAVWQARRGAEEACPGQPLLWLMVVLKSSLWECACLEQGKLGRGLF